MPLHQPRAPWSPPRLRRRNLTAGVAGVLVLAALLLASGGRVPPGVAGNTGPYVKSANTALRSLANHRAEAEGTHPDRQVRLRVSPETPWARPGEEVTYALYAEGGTGVSGAEVTLSYGPDLELLNITPGPYLGEETIAAPAARDNSSSRATYAWARIGETPPQVPAGELAVVTMKATRGRPWNTWVTARVELADGSFRKLQETTLSFDLHVYDRVPAPSPVFPTSGADGGPAVTGPTPLLGVRTLSQGTLQYRIEVSRDHFQTVLHTFDQTISPQGWDRREYGGGDTAEFQLATPLDPGLYQWRAYVRVREIAQWSQASEPGEFRVSFQSMGLTRVRPGVVKDFSDEGATITLEGWGLAPGTRVSLAAPGGAPLPATIRRTNGSAINAYLPPDAGPGLVIVTLHRAYSSDLVAPVLLLPQAWITVQTLLPRARQVVPGRAFPVRVVASNLGAGTGGRAIVAVSLPDPEVFQLAGVKAARGGQVLEQSQDRVLLSVAGGDVVDFRFRLLSTPVAEGSLLEFDFDPEVVGAVAEDRWQDLEPLPLAQKVQVAEKEAAEEWRRIARGLNGVPPKVLRRWVLGLTTYSDSPEVGRELLLQMQRYGLQLERIDGTALPVTFAVGGGPAQQEDPGGPRSRGSLGCCPRNPVRLAVARSVVTPGDLVGYPQSPGGRAYIAGDQPIGYSIRFENPAEAGEPVEDVRVMAQLDPAIDLETLRVVSTTHPDSMTVELDQSNNTATWSFGNINLPPNREPPQGEGRIEFRANLQRGAPSGRTVEVRAAVRFGTGQPRETNGIEYTVDAGPPVTRVSPMPPVQLDPTFQINWEGDDGEGESGIERVTLLASKNGEPFEVVGTTVGPTFDFRGEPGATYGFATVARDRVGYVEASPSEPDVEVNVGQRLSFSGGLHLVGLPVFTEGDPGHTLDAPGSVRWTWDPVRQDYAPEGAPGAGTPPEANRPGQGWWVKYDRATSPMVSGRTPPPGQPYSIDLHPGWNLIASPFPVGVPWSLDRIKVRASGVEKTLGEAQQLGWVEDYAWGWKGDSYTLVYDTAVLPGVASSLEPFRGYWLQAHRDLALVLSPPQLSQRKAGPNVD